jgi:indolepyruvate ferredoxin oxidoreductase
VIINDLVCEGCGDCGITSNCVSVQPIDTEFGRKRQIDQSSCNKDFSCVQGFCPSFVTVHGAKPKKGAPQKIEAGNWPDLPNPKMRAIGDTPYGILVTGVGGTGIVTISAILGMAAHIENKGVGIIDMAGLAQKGGAVYCHVKIANRPEDIHAIRVAAGEADLVLACDLVVAGTKKVLASIDKGETGVVVNTAEVYPGDFTRNADFSLPAERVKRALRSTAGEGISFIDATSIATALMGNSIAANMFMLGFAWQQGLVPLSEAAVLKAIELNGEAIEMNTQAFVWGRRAAADPAAVDAFVTPLRKPTASRQLSQTLDEIVARRVAFLADYQSAAYAECYRALVRRVGEVERARVPGEAALAEAVAKYLFKLMAYKDEYEVARLYTDGSFAKQLAATFEGDMRMEVHLAPPILGRKDDKGHPRKTTFGPWMFKAFGLLARFKFLRGTPLDIFGYSEERRTERKLIADYEAMIEEILTRLSPEKHAIAVALASIPEKIRGFGHVKARHLIPAKAEEADLLAKFRGETPALPLAAE